MKLNEKKIAFIICSNDEQETEECLFYLANLKIPEEYEKDIVLVHNASSMASGYNTGMKRTDAKYKVYMHQDTFIINQNFIFELLDIFRADRKIGLLGCVGCRRMAADGYAVSCWDTGKVYHNLDICHYYEHEVCEVDVVDGLLLATQYDIPWREDIFQGWDYYDISQCYEFHRKGWKVVVPEQKEYWCYHDNRYSRLTAYDEWQKKFVEEYQDIGKFKYEGHISSNDREMEKLIRLLSQLLEEHLDAGRMAEFHEICTNPEVQNQLWAREYCVINRVYETEKAASSQKQIFQGNAKKTLQHLRRLKHLLKRIEYKAGEAEYSIAEIKEKYSLYAICIVCIGYCQNRKMIYERILTYYRENGYKEEAEKLFQFREKMTAPVNMEALYMCTLVAPDDGWREEREKEQILFLTENLEKDRDILLKMCDTFRAQYGICLVVQQYEMARDAEVLQQLDEKHIETFCAQQPMHLVWDMREKLYQAFHKVVVFGSEMEPVVEKWHRTHIPVYWYMEKDKIEEITGYSDNIMLLPLER